MQSATLRYAVGQFCNGHPTTNPSGVADDTITLDPVNVAIIFILKIYL